MEHLKIDIADLRSNVLVRAPKALRGTPGGTPNPTTPIRYAKLAQIVNGELRCFEFSLPRNTPGGVLQGNDLKTFEDSPNVAITFPGPGIFCDGQPPVPPPQVGDTFEILAGPDAGSYQIVGFAEAAPCWVLILNQNLTTTNTDGVIPWRIEVSDQPPDPDAPLVLNYSQVFKARAVPGSPLHRYRPYLGPGDHTGTDLVTTNGIATFTHQGADGGHFAEQNIFAAASGVFLGDADADPPIPPVNFGDVLEILSGPEQGSYLITQVTSDQTLVTDHVFTNSATDVDWQIVVPDPDAPRSSPTATSDSANFTDPLNPVQAGMYLEIEGGPDLGRHEIINVVSSTQLELASDITANATGLSYRIDIVSDHATTLQIVPVSGQLVAAPDQDSVLVKIARAIRDEDDALNLDEFRELLTTEALDLFNEHGAYLACYRLQVGASHAQGLPIDDRVIIAAMPWRGHLVNSVLFFDDNNDQKYDLLDDNEPVLPARWLRDHYSVELAIARAKRQEPTQAETCP